jgi:hypothetical protein
MQMSVRPRSERDAEGYLGRAELSAEMKRARLHRPGAEVSSRDFSPARERASGPSTARHLSVVVHSEHMRETLAFTLQAGIPLDNDQTVAWDVRGERERGGRAYALVRVRKQAPRSGQDSLSWAQVGSDTLWRPQRKPGDLVQRPGVVDRPGLGTQLDLDPGVATLTDRAVLVRASGGWMLAVAGASLPVRGLGLSAAPVASGGLAARAREGSRERVLR